jgi:hypothetical protein
MSRAVPQRASEEGPGTLGGEGAKADPEDLRDAGRLLGLY